MTIAESGVKTLTLVSEKSEVRRVELGIELNCWFIGGEGWPHSKLVTATWVGCHHRLDRLDILVLKRRVESRLGRPLTAAITAASSARAGAALMTKAANAASAACRMRIVPSLGPIQPIRWCQLSSDTNAADGGGNRFSATKARRA